MSRLSETERERIAARFDRHLEVGLHHGAQLAVFVDGELAIDLAGGVTGPSDGGDGDGGPEPTTSSQRHVLFSCTKPYAAVTLHTLVDEGKLAYDDRVVDHWPAFADEGSEKAEITVRQVLSHTAGLPRSPLDARPDRWPDWEDCIEAIEDLEPTFPPGERAAYHSLTFGWLVGELVRRVSGDPIEEAAAKRVFEPLGMTETGIGLREDEPDDVATLVGFEAFDRCRDPGEGLGDHRLVAEPFNEESVHRSVVPAANGIGTARDMARFYACLANGGELEGTRILSAETVDALTTLEAETDEDGTLSRPSRFALGVWKGDTPADPFGSLTPPRVFGHAGLGSSVGWADPETNVAFAYVTNGVREGSFEHVTRVRELADAVRLARR
ncbi:CubicO group peptidase, beta-lactamase class C family [Halobiforma haloterrestris]|uniref:CubicO group peptidase, beta-lactamase class C family n=1 Tax=Natronobacterium haloterrestre TaxID=148448 RepID=A0A1I1EEV7_NATHA|nr:serine hydrolase domain-containing protein [Halobiforma haloterrestris]SFB85266.1 CubicO group peptidase, beta-lactamase class C family [Halobiforma haloterrestris]